MTRSLLLILEYDGTDYAGFQRQRDRPTVQAEVERAIERLTGHPTAVRAAGRTDAGVHAAGLPASFRTTWSGPLDRLVKGLNHFLPPAIAVREARPVPDEFDVRRWAQSRRYRYTVLSRDTRSPLKERFAYRVPGRLDCPAMAEALGCLEGEHDFASFAASLARGSTVRRLTAARLRREDDCLFFDFAGTAFLMHQIRNTVGTLLWVGQERLSPADFRAILAVRDRRLAGPAAPPHGLCLMGVDYGPWTIDDGPQTI
jgi:tRNA pseudouridine38-40 synthase